MNPQPNSNRIGLRTRQILGEIRALDEPNDLSAQEINLRKTRLASLFLDRPEIAPLVSDALAELERNVNLSREVRDHVIERFEDALMKFPDAAMSRQRLRGLMRKVIFWGIGSAVRIGTDGEGNYLEDHPANASSLDRKIENPEGEGSSMYSLVEDPARVDLTEVLMQQERIETILKLAEQEGPATHRTVLRVMLGWSYQDVAATEGVSENAIAQRLRRFRDSAEHHGV